MDHDLSHVHAAGEFRLPAEARRDRRSALARQLRRNKAIMGVFDEGCMGMYNAIIPDELLHADRRFQGAAEPIGAVRRDAARSRDDEARRGARSGSTSKGMKFCTGPDPETDLTDAADPRAVQDVHCGAADRRRFRLRRDRHSVPAGA